MSIVRLVGISDIHGRHEEVNPPQGDILIVAGDFCNHGTMKEVISFNKWLGTLPHTHKIVVAGNHDLYCEGNRDMTKLLFTNAIYLDTEAVNIMGINFFGCPWTPEFYNWAFMYPRKSPQAWKIWDRMPENTDVLISHGPPYGTKFGLVGYCEDVGCEVQREKIIQTPNLKVSFSGHLHANYGQDKVHNAACLNVAVMNDNYKVVRHGQIYNYKGK